MAACALQSIIILEKMKTFLIVRYSVAFNARKSIGGHKIIV